jgi:hypothetical protein
VWRTAKNPISAPRCFGSAAMVLSVSAVTRKRMPKDQFFILVGDRRDVLWHGKDNMKIADLQKFGLSVLDPLRPCERLTFWAVPVPAAIETIAFMATLITTLEVAAECGCAAHLDCGHDAP